MVLDLYLLSFNFVSVLDQKSDFQHVKLDFVTGNPVNYTIIDSMIMLIEIVHFNKATWQVNTKEIVWNITPPAHSSYSSPC